MTFNRLAVALLFIVITAAACLMPAQNDTFWHLRAGFEAWHGGMPLYRDVFSHTAYGEYWPNHEWLTQTTFYAVYAVAGLPGVTLLCAVAVTGAWALSFRVMRGTATLRVCLVAAAIPVSATLWSLRPQAISLGFISVCVWLISTDRLWRRGASVAGLSPAGLALPLVCATWANFHGAALLAVVLLIGALAASVVYDRARSRALAIALVMSAAAMCFTPLGIRWWPEMIVSLARIRSISISEWQPPTLLEPTDAVFWITAIVLLVLVWRRHRELSRDGAVVVGMALALLPLAISAGRNVSPFLLAALPALTRVLPERLLLWEAGLARRPARPAHTGVLSAAAFGAVLVVALAWSRPAQRLGWRPLPDSVVAAVEACPANLYNRYDDGGYFIWFTPGQRVFLDGRQDPFPLQLIREHRATETAGDFRGLFHRYGIRCAAIPSSSATAANLLHSGWHQRARDGGWIVLTE